jgi:hypothetical protein
MAAWDDKRTWRAKRDVERRHEQFMEFVKDTFAPSGQEPHTDMDTGLPVGAPVSERPSVPAEPSCPVIPLNEDEAA